MRQEEFVLVFREMPVPVSETQITTVSASEWAMVETRISRNAEFSRASAALSMRFTTTLRSRPPSARTGGRFSQGRLERDAIEPSGEYFHGLMDDDVGIGRHKLGVGKRTNPRTR